MGSMRICWRYAANRSAVSRNTTATTMNFKGRVKLQQGLRPEFTPLQLGLDHPLNARIVNVDETFDIVFIIGYDAPMRLQYVHANNELPNALLPDCPEGAFSRDMIQD